MHYEVIGIEEPVLQVGLQNFIRKRRKLSV